MSRAVIFLLGLVLVSGLAGCENLGPWGGPAYQLDMDKIGTGDQAITPRNDYGYWNGQPQDMRTRR